MHSTWYGRQRGKTHSTNNSFCGGAGFLGGGSWGCALFAPVDGGGWGWCHPPFVLGRQDWPVLQEVELRHCGCALFSFSGPAPEVVQNRIMFSLSYISFARFAWRFDWCCPPNLESSVALIISFFGGCALGPGMLHPCGRGNSAIRDT